ncbi:MAG TPA: phosphohistidine phosphatase SixA [Gemmataceae bacterium]|nr:phosphohistidine phosphatase SixA [Gemmataceae bacterium]
MLHLYLIRHADAVPRGDPNFADDDRPLTEKGKQQSQALGRTLTGHGLKFDVILCSPLPRAQETLEGLLESLEAKPPVEYCPELRPGGKAKKLDREIVKHPGGSIALVGHEPDLGEYAARLIGSKKASIALAKGGVACVACTDPPGKRCGSLTWMITPEWFEKS